ncbi:MAG TPA: energy transducer TonB [Thermoanaerobaculia bacterium]
MDEQIELLAAEQNQQTPGVRVPGPVIVSVIVHILLIIGLIHAYHPITSDDKPVPIARYIELIKQNPKDFTEAPGKSVDKAPLNALWSDANRRASAPHPTGDTPTQRPGDRGVYTPPIESAAQPAPAQQASTENRGTRNEDTQALPADISSRIPALRTSQAAMSSGNVNWRDAIKEVGKVASLGGGQNLDLSKIGGGDKGFVEQGPLSFETQWYDWGAYAQSMVSKIRINWYDNMPPLIRTGMKGVVTIRFAIQRDGSITDITILNSSGVPPYDFAAKKAIELSSPLNPLPADFPKSSEHVTAMFFYNSEPPTR